MQDIALGILAVLVGLFLVTRGQWAARFMITIWGAFVGFAAGASIVAAVTGDNLFATALGWTLGVILGLVFAVFAYLYYAVAVVIALSSMGFLIGATVTQAIGISWTWLYSLVGLAFGVAFAIWAIAANLPRILLIVLSASAGATVTIAGVMLVFNILDAVDFADAGLAVSISDYVFWYIAYLVLFIAGIAIQYRDALKQSAELREAWAKAAPPSAATA